MAYHMRFRVRVFLVGDTGEATDADTVALDVGSLADAPAAGVVFLTSENKAVGAAMAMVRRLQSGFYQNARAEITGKPIGAPEAGNPDLSAGQKLERVYATIDTPNPSLLYAIHQANKKVSAPVGAFVPAVDDIPEANVAPDFIA